LGMGLIALVKGLFRRGFLTTAIPQSGSFTGGLSPRDASAWIAAYKRNPRLRAAVRRIAKDAAKTEFFFQAMGRDGKPIRLQSGPLLDWQQAPWQMMRGGTWQQFVFLCCAYHTLVGSAFAVFRRENGRLVETVPIAGHMVQPLKIQTKDGQSEIIFQVQRPGDEVPIVVPGSEMFWWRDPDLHRPLEAGNGQAQCLDDEIELDEAAAKYNLSYFRNSATPHALVTVKGASPDQLQQIRQQWNDTYGGSVNKFRSAFTSQDIAVNALGPTQKDMEFVEGRRFSRDAIYQTFTLPPEVMGVVENSNRATAEAALYLYALNIILPLVTEFAAEVNRQIVPQIDKSGVKLAFENPVRETEEFRLKKATELFKAGAITRDECRIINGFDPMGGQQGQELLVPTNMAPNGQLITETRTVYANGRAV